MQIVIEIDEDVYKLIKRLPSDSQELTIENAMEKAIYNGTPLPQGHGRLIDADELKEDFCDGTEGYDCHSFTRIDIGDVIDDVPTVIEADKHIESEGKE